MPAVKDELTENGLIRRWSKEFYFNADMPYDTETSLEITLKNSNNHLFVFNLTPDYFGDELPNQNNEVLTWAIAPCAFTRSKDFILNYSSAIGNSAAPLIALEYDNITDPNNPVYHIYFLVGSGTNTIAKLLNTKLYMVYVLNSPKYEYKINKFLGQENMTINFVQEAVSSTDSDVNSKIKEMSSAPLTGTISVPTSTGAIINNLKPIISNINDLNNSSNRLSIAETDIANLKLQINRDILEEDNTFTGINTFSNKV